MLKEKFISITDLRKNATKYISNLWKNWEKIIFINNKPMAVLLDFDEYEKLIQNEDKIDLAFVPNEKLNEEQKKEVEELKKLKEDDFVNL